MTECEDFSTCDGCSEQGVFMKSCEKCGNVDYCNDICEEKAWNKHKCICNPKINNNLIDILAEMCSEFLSDCKNRTNFLAKKKKENKDCVDSNQTEDFILVK
jgi:hypothetical protein